VVVAGGVDGVFWVGACAPPCGVVVAGGCVPPVPALAPPVPVAPLAPVEGGGT
jgi:hypothetical protein